MNDFLKSLTGSFLVQAVLFAAVLFLLTASLLSITARSVHKKCGEEDVRRRMFIAKKELKFQQKRIDKLYEQTDSLFLNLKHNRSLNELLNTPSAAVQAEFSAYLQHVTASSAYIKGILVVDEGDTVIAGAYRTESSEESAAAPLSFGIRPLHIHPLEPHNDTDGTNQLGPQSFSSKKEALTTLWHPSAHQRKEKQKHPLFSGFTFLLDKNHNPIIQARLYGCFYGEKEGRHCHVIVELDTAALFSDIIESFCMPAANTMLFDGRGRLLATTIKQDEPLIDLNSRRHLSCQASPDWLTIQEHLKEGREGHFQKEGLWYAFLSVQEIDSASNDNFISIVRIIKNPFPEKNFLPVPPLFWGLAALLSLAGGAAFFFWRLEEAGLLLLQRASNGIAGMLLLDDNLTITSANQAVQTICGYSPLSLKGRSLSDLHTPDYRKVFYQQLKTIAKTKGKWEGETVIRHQDGSFFQIRMLLRRINGEYKDDNGERAEEGEVAYLASFINISRLKEVEKQLLTRIEIDPLTRCWNSRFFFDELENQSLLAANYLHRHQSCLVLLNLDNFHDINNNQGFPEGDAALREFAALLIKSFRETDIIARIEGDTFAIIMPHTSMENCNRVINGFRRKTRSVLQKKMTISAGMVQIEPDALGKSAYALANWALLQAKKQGKDQVILATPNKMRASIIEE